MEDKVIKKERFLKGTTSILYVFRNRQTGEFVDEDGNYTEDLYDAVGYQVYEEAYRALETFDEPEDWYIVTKITNISIIGEPIEVKQFI